MTHGFISVLMANTAVALVLAVLALAAGRLGRPAAAHVLWLLVIVKLLTPPIVRVPVTLPIDRATPVVLPSTVPDTGPAPQPKILAPPRAEYRVEGPAPATPIASVSTPVAASSRICLHCVLLFAWAAGSILWLALTLVRIGRFRRLVHRSTAASTLDDEVCCIAAKLGVTRPPEVVLVDAAVSPMLFFLGGRVRLILPLALMNRLSPAQRQGVIAHELAHLRRGDHWVRLVELAATALLWWHPLLWLARRGLREAEEQCCDAWVVTAMPDARRAYADALVDALESSLAGGGRSCGLVLAGATTLGRTGNLRRRITMIFTTTPNRSFSTGGAILITMSLGLTLLSPVGGAAETKVKPAGASVAATAPAAANGNGDAGARETVRALLELAQDPDEQVRQAAAEAIGALHTRAVPALLEALKDPKSAELARRLLAGLGEKAIGPLVDALGSPEAAVRREALETLAMLMNSGGAHAARGGGYGGVPGGMGMEGGGGGFGGMAGGMGMDPAMFGGGFNAEPAPLAPGSEDYRTLVRLIDAVVRAASDEDVGVRRAAVQVLQLLPPCARRVDGTERLGRALTAALKDEDARVRAAALAGLTAPGIATAESVAPLAEAVNDRDRAVRLMALQALQMMGSQAREATPVVIAVLKDPDPMLRASAASTLGALQAPPPAQPQTQPVEVGF